MKYFYADENRRPAGPYTADQMQRFYQQGALRANSWVIAEGGSQWKSFASVFPSSANPQPHGGGQTRCASCGAGNSGDAQFCIQCGAKLSHALAGGASPAPGGNNENTKLFFTKLLKLLFSFQGRINRQPFWIAMIGASVVANVVALPLGLFLGLALSNESYVIFTILCLVCLPLLVIWCWIGLALQVKRWHDAGYSGAMVLINLIPCIGLLIAWVVLGFIKGAMGPNEYGDDPLQSPNVS